MELLAEVAAAGWPELRLAALRNIKVLRGITFGRGAQAVRILAQEVDRAADGCSGAGISLALTMVADDDPSRAHYRATADLRPAQQPGEPPGSPLYRPDDAALQGAGPLPRSIPATYRDWLFHGPLFQGIASIEAIGPKGARTTIRPSVPARWLRGEPAGDWLIDPVVVDSAFQLQVIWARLHWDVTLLPAGVGGYEYVAPLHMRAGRAAGDTAPIHHEMWIRPESRAPLCRVDHYFHDAQGHLLGRLVNVEGAGSKALNRLAGGESE
jgi:hypothetical protein